MTLVLYQIVYTGNSDVAMDGAGVRIRLENNSFTNMSTIRLLKLILFFHIFDFK